MSDKYNYVVAEKPSTDLSAVEAMIADLETYIVQDEVYRTILAPTGAGNRKLRMSGGDLLARLHRLQGERADLTADEQARLDAAQAEADRIIYSLKTRFLERLSREMKARLDSLTWFLDDWDDEPRRGRSDYPFEIRNRQRIEEILKQLKDKISDDLNASLAKVDRRIRQHTQNSGFIWDEPLQKVYPPETYWYLYRRAV
jgi:signal transduction histidine kinase